MASASDERPGRWSPLPYSTNGTGHIVFLTVFIVAWLFHIWQAISFRSLFMWVMLVACTTEWIGYMLCLFAQGQESPSSYLPAYQALLIGTPALLVVQSYIIIERMMDFIGKGYGPVAHNKVTKVFFGLDMIAMALQVVGVSMLEDAVGKLHQAQVGKKILIAGLLLQVITFGIYTAWVMTFDFLSSRDPALRPYKTQLRGLRMLWIAFYVSAVLITIRTIYRIVAFVNVVPSSRELYNQDGDLFNQEWSLYGLESIPILLSVLVFSVWHPGAYLPAGKGSRISDGHKEQRKVGIFRSCGLPWRRQREVATDAAGDSATALQGVRSTTP